MTGERVIGLFERLDPVLSFLDARLEFLITSDAIRLAAWGAIAGVLSMLLYRLVSPQATLRRLAAALKAAHDGARASGATGKLMLRAALSIGPAMLASLPVLLMVGYLNGNYTHQQPVAGVPVAVMAGSGAAISLERGQQFAAGWVVSWPGAGEHVSIRDGNGLQVLVLTATTRAGPARKPDLASYLFGAPAGTLPLASSVDVIAVEPKPRDILRQRLASPYQWTVPFFLALIMASFAVKLVFRIA
jgi:hypothetical protein